MKHVGIESLKREPYTYNQRHVRLFQGRQIDLTAGDYSSFSIRGHFAPPQEDDEHVVILYLTNVETPRAEDPNESLPFQPFLISTI